MPPTSAGTMKEAENAASEDPLLPPEIERLWKEVGDGLDEKQTGKSERERHESFLSAVTVSRPCTAAYKYSYSFVHTPRES